MIAPEARGTLEGQAEAVLELVAVDESGQRSVAGLVRQPRCILAFAADVVEYQNDTGHLAGPIMDGSSRFVDQDLFAAPLYQDHVRRHGHRATGAQYHFDRVERLFPRGLVDDHEHRLDALAPGFRA